MPPALFQDGWPSQSRRATQPLKYRKPASIRWCDASGPCVHSQNASLSKIKKTLHSNSCPQSIIPHDFHSFSCFYTLTKHSIAKPHSLQPTTQQTQARCAPPSSCSPPLALPSRRTDTSARSVTVWNLTFTQDWQQSNRLLISLQVRFRPQLARTRLPPSLLPPRLPTALPRRRKALLPPRLLTALLLPRHRKALLPPRLPTARQLRHR